MKEGKKRKGFKAKNEVDARETVHNRFSGKMNNAASQRAKLSTNDAYKLLRIG